MIPYDFHSEAEAEFAAAVLFYESRLVGLGSSFVREVEQVVAFSRAHPDAGSPLGSKVRRVLVRRFPYSLIYRLEDERLYILAVAHQRRRSGYWRRRT
ncbi:MAG: type II toxin-antitoxin system RelE/ParE family toxin [Gammaproteobacteria bacterium]